MVPQFVSLSWFISPKTQVYGVISIVNGDYKPTNITMGAPPCTIYVGSM